MFPREQITFAKKFRKTGSRFVLAELDGQARSVKLQKSIWVIWRFSRALEIIPCLSVSEDLSSPYKHVRKDKRGVTLQDTYIRTAVC